MWPIVGSVFPLFCDQFEGKLNHMYLDDIGLVTTGRGNLIDPMSAALSLPWLVDADNSPATRQAIQEEWLTIKGATRLDQDGGGAYKSLCKLYLTWPAVDTLCRTKMTENEDILTRRYPRWASFPADAQLALHSLAWACGAWFDFPLMSLALKNGDFAGAAEQISGETIRPARNQANVALMQAAAKVGSGNLDPSMLYGWTPPKGGTP